MKCPLSLLLVLATIAAGCAPEIIPLRSQASVERSYTIGQARTVAPGESMIALRRLSAAPQYEVAFDYTPPQHDMFQGGLDYPALHKGMRFVQVASRGDGAIGLARAGYGVTRSASITKRETYLPVTIWISKDGVVSGSMEGRRWTTDMLFLPLKGSSGPVELMRSEIVLDGVDGPMIDATYREFEGGSSTPSIERPLRFDTTTERRFTAGGVVIEIASATPSGVELTVVEELEE